MSASARGRSALWEGAPAPTRHCEPAGRASSATSVVETGQRARRAGVFRNQHGSNQAASSPIAFHLHTVPVTSASAGGVATNVTGAPRWTYPSREPATWAQGSNQYRAAWYWQVDSPIQTESCDAPSRGWAAQVASCAQGGLVPAGIVRCDVRGLGGPGRLLRPRGLVPAGIGSRQATSPLEDHQVRTSCVQSYQRSQRSQRSSSEGQSLLARLVASPRRHYHRLGKPTWREAVEGRFGIDLRDPGRPGRL
jgi:hypothetical protein